MTALHGVLSHLVALHLDTATLWAAHLAEGEPEYPYRADEKLGGADLFRTSGRTVHVVGDSQVAAEARQALTAGEVPGWTLQPVRSSSTPLHVLQPLLTTRYHGILSRNGFSTVEEVEATPDIGLLALRGAGAKFLDAVHTAVADLGLGELAATRVAAPSPAEEAARRRQLLARQLEPGAALRNRDFVELLARSSIPATGLRLIVDALNAEPPPPAAPAVVALLDTAGENDLLAYYTRSRAGTSAPPIT